MNNVENFHKGLIGLASFDKGLKFEPGKIKNEKTHKVFICNKFMSTTKNQGYNLSSNDVLSYEQDHSQMIKKEKHKCIDTPVIKRITSAFMSFLLLIGNIHVHTKAMLSREVIVESVGRLTGKVPSSAAILSSVAHEGMNETSDVSSQSMSKPVLLGSTVTCGKANSEYVMSALNLLDPYALKISGFVRDLRLFDGNTQTVTEFESVDEGRVPKRKWNSDEGKGSPNYMRTLFPSSAGDLSTSGGSENFARFAADCKPTPELVARIAAYFYKFRHSDQDAMMKDLNKYEKMLDTVSAVTDEKLLDKFYDMIGTYVSARRVYDEAVKKKDAVVCKPMTASQYLEALEKEETEYMIADDILAQIKKIYSDRYHLDDVSMLDAKTVLKDMRANMSAYGLVRKALAKDLETNGPKTIITFEKFVAVKFKKNKDVICAIDGDKECYHDLICIVGDASKKDDVKKAEVQEVVKKNPKLLAVCKSKKENLALEGLYEFFRSNDLAANVTKESLSTNDGIKNAKAILKLLKEGTYMIHEQESDSDEGTKEKYPKYTTERMLMSYFIEYFKEASEVTRFYDEIDRVMPDELVPSSDFSRERLNKLAEIIHNIPTNNNGPYGLGLLGRAQTEMISAPDPVTKEVNFSESEFPDCADTAARHFLNFLFYQEGKNWPDILPDGVSRELKAAKEAVIEAINGRDENKKVKFFKLKDRVKIFFAHQTPGMCNDGSLVTRALWNYVISNMTDVSDEPGLYSIRYACGKNCEFDTGYINMLKLMYNIEKALYAEDPKKSDVLNLVHDNIEKLCREKNSDNLVKAIESIVHVVRPDVNAEIYVDKEHGISVVSDQSVDGDRVISYDDIYGVIHMAFNISPDDVIKFEVYQKPEHAAIKLAKLNIDQLNVDLKGFEDDPIIRCFIQRLFRYSDFGSCNAFYDGFYGQNDSPYFVNSRMLRLFREAYGEENNSIGLLSWLKKSCFSPNASVSLKRENGVVNLSEFFDGIFQACAMKHLGGVDVRLAKPSEDGNYKYIAKGDGVVEIYPNVKLMKQELLEIPAGIGGCNKYIICAGAFNGFVNLKALTFADGIESVGIGDEAFGNSGIKRLIVPGNVKEFKLGVGVFKDTEFETLEISDHVQHIEIGKVRFKDYKLDTIVVPEDVTEFSIPKQAFYNIKFPDTLTIQGKASQSLSIEAEAFARQQPDRFFIDAVIMNMQERLALNIIKELLGGEFTGSISELKVIAKKYDKVLSLIDYLAEQGADSDNSLVKIDLLEFLKPKVFDDVLPGGYSGSIDDLKVLAKHYTELQPIIEDYLKKLGSGMLTLNIGGFGSVIFGNDAFVNSNVNMLNVSEGTRKLIIQARAFDCNYIRDESKITDFVIPSSVEDLTLSYYSCIKGSESKKLVIPPKVKRLVLGCNVFNAIDDEVCIPDHVNELELAGIYIFSGANITKFDFGKVERVILPDGSLAMFAGEELVIPESVKRLELKSLCRSEIKTLEFKLKLDHEKIADSTFSDGVLEKIIVHDEESRKLLDENRAKYGIADTVQIELAPTTTLA